MVTKDTQRGSMSQAKQPANILQKILQLAASLGLLTTMYYLFGILNSASVICNSLGLKGLCGVTLTPHPVDRPKPTIVPPIDFK